MAGIACDICKGCKMVNRLRIYGILVKQYLFKYKWWILLMILFALASGVIEGKNADKEKDYKGIAAGVCWSDEKGKELFEKLEKEKGIFRFQGFKEVSEMVREVENGNLECGYELSEDFYEALLTGKAKGQVTLYYSPASSAHKISYETMFVNLFEMLSEDILRGYLRENGYGDEGQDADRLLALNRQYAGDGSTFHFVYELTGEKAGTAPENLNSFRGCMAVMMFLMCLLGLGNALEQERAFRALPDPLGKRMKSGCLHAAVFGSVLTGGFCVLIQGIPGRSASLGREIAALLLYGLLLEVYVRILRMFIRRSRVLYGLIPALLMGTSLFSPVFIRIGNYLPAAAWISRIFPATYYLEFFF